MMYQSILRLSRRPSGHFTGPESVERNASGHAGKRRIIRRDIQCADYHGAGAAGIARCALPGGRRSAAVKDNLLIYGLGGVVAPFIGIKLIDMLLVALHIA